MRERWLLAAALLGFLAASLATAPADGAVERTGAVAEAAIRSPIPAEAVIGDGRGGFRLQRVGSFDSPTYVHGPARTKRLLFVVERGGRIAVLRDGRRRGTFLDIRDRVLSGGERGLFSVAFAPRYPKDRRFYVYFTDRTGDLRIQQYKRRRTRPLRASSSSRRNVLRIRHRKFANHNGGQLQFGPDGKLYIGTGDGGGGGDPDGNAQDKRSLLGKLLRINPLRRGRRKAYRVPPTNPLVGRKGRDEIYARGLRNPWRFSFDGRKILIGDVGQSSREEVNAERIDRRLRNANFGWNAWEGTMRFGGSPPPKRHDKPIHEYGHSGGRCSISGGYVARDRRIPALLGRYLYADFCQGGIRSLVPRLAGARRDRPTGLAKVGISSFGVDGRRRLYVASLTADRVWRLAPK